MKNKTIHSLTLVLLWVLVLFSAIASVMPFIPLSWIVRHDFVEYSDICVNETRQLVTTQRHVPFALSAVSFGEVHKITGGIRRETTIRRKANFVYQKESKQIQYTILWDSPFVIEGDYEAIQFVDVHFAGSQSPAKLLEANFL